MVRYLQGTCTEEERIQFLSWLEDDEHESSFFQMKEIFDSRHRMVHIKQKEETKQVSIRSTLARNLQGGGILGRPKKILRYRTWITYAAIFLLIAGGALLFNLIESTDNSSRIFKQMVVHNTRGVYQIVLPDGSKVWLHGGTTLTYPDSFSDSLRVVDLQGEAYFSVQADVNHPFVVQTPTAKIRATGTEFNITAYPGDQITTTTLVKGTVAVQPNHLTTSIKLKPNQQASVKVGDAQIHVSEMINSVAVTAEEKKTPVVVQDINTDLYTDWKDGIYRFKNEPFQNIVLRLEKMYGVRIQIESDDLRMSAFSGMFTTDYSLKEIFEIINISNPITFKVENKIVYIRNK